MSRVCGGICSRSHMLMNLDNLSEACVIIIVCSPQAIFNIFKVYVLFFPSFKHNVMQTLCPFQSAIFQVCYNCDCNNTPLYVTRYYPAVTCVQPNFKQELTVYTGVEICASSCSAHSPQTILSYHVCMLMFRNLYISY
jgi:hypothetical protein